MKATLQAETLGFMGLVLGYEPSPGWHAFFKMYFTVSVRSAACW